MTEWSDDSVNLLVVTYHNAATKTKLKKKQNVAKE